MKKILLSLVLPFGLVLSHGATAFAGDSCSPDIKVINTHEHGVSIKVTKLEYRLKGTTVWHTEDVTNKVLHQDGESFTFKSQKLSSADKGSKMDWRAEFEQDDGRGYGAAQKSKIALTSSTACENNVTYTVKVGVQ